MDPLVVRLRAELSSERLRAMKARDASALKAARTALSALDNAEAVPLAEVPTAGAIEAGAVGVGVVDAARRELSWAGAVAVVEQEIGECDRAAEELRAAGSDHAGRVADIAAQALCLRAVLKRVESPD